MILWSLKDEYCFEDVPNATGIIMKYPFAQLQQHIFVTGSLLRSPLAQNTVESQIIQIQNIIDGKAPQKKNNGAYACKSSESESPATNVNPIQNQP